MTGALSRRRVLAVSAAVAGLAALPVRSWATESPVRTWRGVALGADACIQLAHPDKAEAERLIHLCLEEVARLERVFSLYRQDSALARLNREGVLDEPPADLVRLLAEAVAFGNRTGGAFDVTVQPLWKLYASHFARPGADLAGPPAAAVSAVRTLVDYRSLRVEPDRITFDRRGMAVTLNGIAQGYVTDRVAERLRKEGMDRVLVDLGETRALGGHPSGGPWTVGLRDPLDESRTTATLEISDAAIATTGGYGTRFDPAGRFTHVLDPASGRSANTWLAVTVQAADATTADALSTALAVVPADKAEDVIRRQPGVLAHMTRRDGSVLVMRA